MGRRRDAGPGTFVPAWPGQVASLGYIIGPMLEDDLGIELTDEQRDRLIAYYQLDPVSGRRLVRRAAIRRPKGAGKPLALDTPLATPSGWTTIGDIRVGDEVFGPKGDVRKVRVVHPVLTDEPTYRVEFAGDAVLVAGAGHLWQAEDALCGSAARLVDTATLATRPARWRVGGRSLGVEAIRPVRMRCITIDHPDGMFLAGEHLIPTHNSPEGAYCGYAELVLPTVFAGWDDDGQPLATPHHSPWVQFAAVSEDQTANVVVWLFDTLSGRPDVVRERGIDLGRTRIYLTGRPGRAEPVTAAAGSREGQPVTFACLDQTESWFRQNGGIKLADTIRRNAAKNDGWTLELQNAPALGDGSVADQTAKASDRRARGVLYDTREPPGVDKLDMADPDSLRLALAFAYGASAKDEGGWVDLDRLVEEILDPDTDPADAKRYYLNTAAPSSDWAFDRPRWGELTVHDGIPPAGELIVLGFDGSRHDDATVLVGTGVESGVSWTVGAWERPPDAGDDWEVPEGEVNDAVEEAWDVWQPWRLYGDPPYWETTMASWEPKYRGPDKKPAVVNWWTNRWRPIGYACRAAAAEVRSGAAKHHVDLDEAGKAMDDPLNRHVRNAVKKRVNARDDQGKPLWTLAKPSPGLKIDAAMAWVLSREARRDAIAAGATAKKRRKSFAL